MYIEIKDNDPKITGKVLDFLNENGIEHLIDTPKGLFIRSEVNFSIENGDLEEDANIEKIVDFIGDDYNFCDGLMDNYRTALREYQVLKK